MLKIICVLKSGGDFDRDDVYNLKIQIDANISCKYEFICYSDVDSVADAALNRNLKGWWSKIEIFNEAGPCIFFDLDTAIFGDIMPLAEHITRNAGCFLMLKGFNTTGKFSDKRRASGVMAWNGAFPFIEKEFNREHLTLRYDQIYISRSLDSKGIEVGFINDVIPEIFSYKRHCRGGVPVGAAIVCFHGKPRPREVGFPFWQRSLAEAV